MHAGADWSPSQDTRSTPRALQARGAMAGASRKRDLTRLAIGAILCTQSAIAD
jgi:hypothetical protein